MTPQGSKQVLEHRHVMEKHLGRKLHPYEVVHHRDEDGLNNAVENLEVMTRTAHRRKHGGPRKWPLESALLLRSAGWPMHKIAKLYGVNYSSIRKQFVRQGVSTKNRRHGTYRWDVEKAAQLYREGMALAEIARLAGVAAPTVRKTFIKNGLTRA